MTGVQTCALPIFVSGVVIPALRLVRTIRKPFASTSTVITQISSMNDLVAVKYVVEKIVKLEGEQTLLGKDSVVLLMHAVVKAGVDLSAPLSCETIAEIRSVWLKHLVLSFPDQRMTDDDLERFGRW